VNRRHRRCHEVLVAKAIGEESAHGTAGDVESLALVAWKKWLCYGYAMAILDGEKCHHFIMSEKNGGRKLWYPFSS